VRLAAREFGNHAQKLHIIHVLAIHSAAAAGMYSFDWPRLLFIATKSSCVCLIIGLYLGVHISTCRSYQEDEYGS
jgi:ABC-type Mn2+/Zn2+ transport system permease subunit